MPVPRFASRAPFGFSGVFRGPAGLNIGSGVHCSLNVSCHMQGRRGGSTVKSKYSDPFSVSAFGDSSLCSIRG